MHSHKHLLVVTVSASICMFIIVAHLTFVIYFFSWYVATNERWS